LVFRYPRLIDSEDKRLIEPFAGGGAVFFYNEPKAALLSDSNDELINTYLGVRDECGEVLERLREHEKRHSKEYYYEVRATRPTTVAEKAARLIYLNRTAFNGIYRVNKRGEFNVPVGTRKNVLREDDDYEAWRELLRRSELCAQDYSETIRLASEDDFLYADPPYTVKHNNNNFVKYNERIFSWADQVRLAECLRAATHRGVYVVLSNANNEAIRELYSGRGWVQLAIDRTSTIGASADSRKRTTEVVISNCVNQQGDRTNARACEVKTGRR
jgi:DNA adenine methylase